jgi:hypothetical protein
MPSHRSQGAALFLMLCLSGAAVGDPAEAQEAGSRELGAGSADTTFVPNELPALHVPRLSDPIRVDGDLTDPGWLLAAKAKNFSENFPVEKGKPSVETEAWIAYDDQNLYLAFVAEDDPGAVRANLRDRDQIFSEDFVGILLDTYGDATWAYEIFANPLGVQGDLRWTRDNEDERFDIVFYSKGQITANGYQVEMAIPFSSIRFPNKTEQVWRATFWRTHPRDSRRQYTWAALERGAPCWPCQWGTLEGIRDVKPGSKLDLLPAAVASQYGARTNPGTPQSAIDMEKAKAELSLNARYAITSSFLGEGAVNPDFSQVESDASQVSVNTTFALIYPEKRPFFQEGIDLLDTYVDAIYTRSINNPSVAGRLTGRPSRQGTAYIVARDIDTPYILPFQEASAFVPAGPSVSNIARYKRSVLEDSYVGGLLTDRRLDGGGSGTVYGGDGRIRFLKDYSVEFQVLGSHTEEPNDTTLTEGRTPQPYFNYGRYTTAFDGEKFSGSAVYTSLEKSGRNWNFDLDYWGYSPTFRAENGAVTSNDYRQANGWTGYQIRPGGFFDRIEPNISFGKQWNWQGTPKDEWINPEIYTQFKGQTESFVAYRHSKERFRDIEFSGIDRFVFYANSRFSNPVSIGTYWEVGDFIARRENPAPILGSGYYFEVWSTLKPLTQLVLDPSIIYQTLDRPDQSNVFQGYILRVRGQYQFTRELFVRLIVDYDNFGDQLSVEPLISYKLNPFTVGYVGSTHAMWRYDQDSSMEEQERQYFAKIQYLFQM